MEKTEYSNVEVRFDIDDEIWFMFQNKATKAKVLNIVASIRVNSKKEIKKLVIITPNNNTVGINQDRCFKTKKDLLENL